MEAILKEHRFQSAEEVKEAVIMAFMEVMGKDL
jgi:hypothetical protein